MRTLAIRAGRTLPLVVMLLGWALLFRPQALGGPAEYIVVRGDSMLPTNHGGDLVILLSETAYAVGDIVGYRVPAGELGAGRVVLHRILGGDGAAGFVIQGDNNPAPDPWHPRTADVVGRAWVTIPMLGRLVALLHVPAIAASAAVALLAALRVHRRTPKTGVTGAWPEPDPGLL